MPNEQVSGRVTLLRAHEVGAGFGPFRDHIDAEVVVRLDSHPSMAFGFQLRDDANLPVRRRMLDLLRDAFKHDALVTIDCSREAGKNNGLIQNVVQSPVPEPHFQEVPAPLKASDDPILRGVRLDPGELLAQFPDPPPGEQEPPGLLQKTDWLPIVEQKLAVKESRQIDLAVTGPLLLFARVTWFGSAVPIAVKAVFDGVELARGEVTTIPPDRGTILLRTEITKAGSTSVLVENATDRSVDIQVVIGVLRVSTVDGGQ